MEDAIDTQQHEVSSSSRTSQLASHEWIHALLGKLQNLSDQQSSFDDFSRSSDEEEESVQYAMSEEEKEEEDQHQQAPKDLYDRIKLPQIKNNYLISPPPSPPDDWHPVPEDINRVPFFDLTPHYDPETNQTLLFHPQLIDIQTTSETHPPSDDTKFSPSIFSFASPSSQSPAPSTGSTLFAAHSPVKRSPTAMPPKRKQEDQLDRFSSNRTHQPFEFSPVQSSDIHPSQTFSPAPPPPSLQLSRHEALQREKEERRRKNNSQNNSAVISRYEDTSSEDESLGSPKGRFSLPAIVITHDTTIF